MGMNASVGIRVFSEKVQKYYIVCKYLLKSTIAPITDHGWEH